MSKVVRIKDKIVQQEGSYQVSGGFTLVEVLMAAAILLMALASLLMVYVQVTELGELSRNNYLALSAAQSRIELIQDSLQVAKEDDTVTFTSVVAQYDGVSFSADVGRDGRGVSYIDTSDSDFYVITVSVSWRQSKGRVIGDDQNLNGALDSGEDADGNAILDSGIQLTTGFYTK